MAAPRMTDLFRRSQIAYHGSPYKFSQFRLDDEVMESGYGSTKEGWGIYFTDSLEEVRTQYSKPKWTLQGRPWDRLSRAERYLLQLANYYMEDAEPGHEEEHFRDHVAPIFIGSVARDGRLEDRPDEVSPEFEREIVDAARRIMANPKIERDAAGYIYRVQLPGKDQLLQDEEGKAIYADHVKRLGSPKAASMALKQKGIAGREYDDPWALTHTRERTVRSFVIWDVDRIKILSVDEI